MPYTEPELVYNQFYQDVINRDEVGYKEFRDKYISKWTGGPLRDTDSTILLFEKIVEGEGSYGDSYEHESQKISSNSTYFIYDESDEINNIIDREFLEL
tara:strand:+ start:178 stop:474 length:297 start_codon:yes stop_codon:yes gene_type:complete